MLELLNRLPAYDLAGTLISLTCIAGVTLLLLTAILLKHWSRLSRRQLVQPLMVGLAARGFSSEEIDQIFESVLPEEGSSFSLWYRGRLPGKNARDNVQAVAQQVH